MIIAIDTREQSPFEFPGIPTQIGTLPTGDYSIVRMTSRIAIERKSLPDLYSTVGQGRDRFERELERLCEMEYAAVVIESTWEDIARRPPSYSQLQPKTVVRSLLTWSQRFNVHVFAAGPKPLAARLTYLILDRFFRDTQEGKRRVNR